MMLNFSYWHDPFVVLLESFFLVGLIGLVVRVWQQRQRLKEANRKLWLDHLLERLRADVMTMANNESLERIFQDLVIEINREKLLDFELCVVNIVDEKHNQRLLYNIGPTGFVVLDRYLFSDASEEFKSIWKEKRTVVRKIQGLWRDNFDVLRRRMKIQETRPLSVVIDVPFDQGTLSFSTVNPAGFSQEEKDAIEKLASVVSLGYTRFLEVQHLEDRVAERTEEISQRVRYQEAILAIERAVQAMTVPADVQNVMRVCLAQLQRLGVDGQVFALHRFLFESKTETFRMGEGGPIGTPTIRDNETLFDLWQKQTTMYVKDYELEVSEAKIAEIRLQLGNFPTRCSIDVPFDRGVLSVHSIRAAAFSEDDVAVLGQIASIISIGFTRLTDLEHLEEKNRVLGDSEERFRQLADATFEGIVVHNDGCIEDVNGQFCAMVGYDAAELMGREILDLVVPDYRALAVQNYERGIQATYELELLRKDGSRFPVEMLGRSYSPERKAIRVVVVRDLTERRQMEFERIRTQRLRAVGELSAGVSHNLNNILMGILGPVQMLMTSISDASVIEDVKLIHESALRARDLVLRLHKAVHNDDLQLEPVLVNEVVQEAIRVSRPKWKDEPASKGISFSIETDLALVPPIEGTSSGLYDILVNLIFNAVDAMPNGGAITIGSQCENDQVVLRVADVGVGMAEEVQARIFEPFFTTKADVGTGLGLSTAYTMVSRWGGRINVASSVGQGTTFTLYLPCWKGESIPMPLSDEAPLAANVNRVRVLLVEDEAVVRRVLVRGLTQCDVVTVADGALALAQFEPGAFDVVITDLGLPDMSGDQVAVALRKKDPAVAIVLFTGWAIPAQDVRRESFDFVLQKPIGDIQEVQRLVHQAALLHRERLAQRV